MLMMLRLRSKLKCCCCAITLKIVQDEFPITCHDFETHQREKHCRSGSESDFTEFQSATSTNEETLNSSEGFDEKTTLNVSKIFDYSVQFALKR